MHISASQPKQRDAMLLGASSPLPAEPESVSLPSLQEKIWQQAYSNLRSEEPGLVKAFEKIILSELQPGTNTATSTNRIEVTSLQMQQLIQIGIDRTKKEISIKQGIDDGLQAVNAIRGIIDGAFRAAPEAAVIWATVSLGIDVLTNPVTEALKNRQGIQYVIGRTQWYWSLADLLLDENKSDRATAVLRDRLEKNIIELFQKLLLYQIRSICLYRRNQIVTVLRDALLIDDWAGKLADIKEAENSVQSDMDQYNTQESQIKMNELNNTTAALQTSLKSVYAEMQSQAERREDDKDKQCLADLYVTDPRTDKKTIEDKKGGLLKDSYKWILQHKDFLNFKNNEESQILWIKGNPGKGKTMLLCGIIDELESDPSISPYYFFCQATGGDRLNTATSVLRGLIYHLARRNPQLIKHVRTKYDYIGEKIFQNESAWHEVCEIATAMLEDSSLQKPILIVDALDECMVGRDHLLDFITKPSPAKWIVSSRNWVDIEGSLSDTDQKTLEGHSSVTSVVFSNDGQRLASGSRDDTVKIWDATSGACLQTLEGHSKTVTSVVFSNNGQRLASGSSDNTVKIWDATSGACLQTLEGHSDYVTSVAFSNDGQRLASGSYDNTIKIWDATSGECLQTLEGHSYGVTSVVFSNDGQRLSSGSEDNTVKVWDATSGACLQTLEGHSYGVTSVVFSNDGQRLASGSWDNTAKIWDATSGACLRTLEGHSDYVTSAIFSNDEKRLASKPPGDQPSLYPKLYNYTLSTDTAWIMQHGQRKLWLPPPCRPTTFVASQTGVGLVLSFKRIIVIGFRSLD
ncbi:Vegetative incompatibility protein HET-E-1 [Ceratocystis platani]|uniref:Vegetative incompatibility protein HET-E-1 n=1 Tax=Ceratocystis fimbriata f. sp. platani TaxID=88771 RepID=A0A0F8D2N4_CERFI|nr:Vegetative incompatibility protein HET-E-1 [Ceratocystis platani]